MKKFLSLILSIIMMITCVFGIIEASAETYEVAYFPMTALNISNRYGPNSGTDAHKAKYCLDLTGNDGSRELAYAPFTGKIVTLNEKYGTCILESKNKVQWANGTVDYMHVLFYHCENLKEFNLYVGKEIKQGQAYYREGAKGEGVTGIHIHLEVGKGKYQGTEPAYYNGKKVSVKLKTQVKPEDALFLKKTTKRLRDVGLNWRVYNPIISISGATVSGTSSKYSGSNINLANAISVKCDGKKLVYGTDYKLSKTSVKAIGKYPITITGKGKYNKTKNITFTVYPKTPTLKTVTSAKDVLGNRTLKLSWARVIECDKNIITISSSSSFPANQTCSFVYDGAKSSGTMLSVKFNGKTKKFKKGEKYYIKMKAYKVVNGEKIYGNYGATKSVTIK